MTFLSTPSSWAMISMTSARRTRTSTGVDHAAAELDVPSSRGEFLSDQADVMSAHGQAMSVEVELICESVEGLDDEPQSMSGKAQCRSAEAEGLGADSHDGGALPGTIKRLPSWDAVPSPDFTVWPL
jgi:hypothetical protein